MKAINILAGLSVWLVAFSAITYANSLVVKQASTFKIDGLKDDWAGIAPRIEDDRGDVKGATRGTDIKAVYAESDGRFLYVMIETWEKPAPVTYEVCVDIDNSGWPDYDYAFGFSKVDAWMYDLRGIANWVWPDERLVELSFSDLPSKIDQVAEMVISLSLFGNPDYIVLEMLNYNWQQDITPDWTYPFDMNLGPQESQTALFDEHPTSYTIPNVTQIWQEKNWCGPASLTIVMNYSGLDVKQQEIGRTIDPEHDGTPIENMVEYAKAHGFTARELLNYVKRTYQFRSSAMDEIRAWVSHGYPVIVDMYYGIEGQWKWEGHYRVVVGYDDRARLVSTVDPNVGRHQLSYEDFDKYWKNTYWGMILVPEHSTKDSDADGISDPVEVLMQTDPFHDDSDGDRLTDKTEVDVGLNPLLRDPSNTVDAINQFLALQPAVREKLQNASTYTSRDALRLSKLAQDSLQNAEESFAKKEFAKAMADLEEANRLLGEAEESERTATRSEAELTTQHNATLVAAAAAMMAVIALLGIVTYHKHRKQRFT